jgi:hypothetical protein
VDECYDRGVALVIDAAVPLEALYRQGYLEFALRRTLSRVDEMQLERFGRSAHQRTHSRHFRQRSLCLDLGNKVVEDRILRA